VPRSALHYRLRIILTLLILVEASFADTPAPTFSLRSLDGQTFSNASLNGNIVLLEFWATWCPYCRKDQPAVDAIQSEYAGRGVVVVAVDVGEDESIVKQYLQKSPRSCSVALDESNAVTSRFGMDGVPHYVVIDRSGNVVAVRSGAIGEQGLRNMLSRADREPSPTPGRKQTQTAEAGATPPAGGAGPQWTFVSGGQSFLPNKPIPKTIFVLTNGERLESNHYVIGGGFIDANVAGEHRHIALASLDTRKTIALNHEHGVDLKFPTGKNEVFLGF
jgi:cytochrome c biogenesis protein CcmG/thiol:disulfide interchange protein DsbE